MERHLDVICRVGSSDVRRWKVKEVVAVNEANKTLTVRLNEWPRVVVTVPPSRLHEHKASLAV